MGTALIRPHPLSSRDQAVIDFPAGHSIADLARMFWPDDAVQRHVVAFVGSWCVPRERWASIRPKAGAVVRLGLTCFEGGGGNNKTILALVAMVVIAIVAPYAAAAMGFQGAAASAVAAGITIAGSLAISALFKPPMIDVGAAAANPQDAQTYSITGQQNAATPYGPMLRVYGRHRIFPRLAAVPFTIAEGPHQFLYMLLDCGYGPLQIDDLFIGDTPILNYRDVLFRIWPRWKAGDPLEIYRNDVTYETFSAVLAQNVPEFRTTAPDASGIVFDFAFVRGLVTFDDRGNRMARSAGFDAYVRPAGSGGAWQHVRQFPVYTSHPNTADVTIGAFNTFPEGRGFALGATRLVLQVPFGTAQPGDILYFASWEHYTIIATAPWALAGHTLITISPGLILGFPFPPGGTPIQSPVLRPTGPHGVIVITDATPSPIFFSMTVDVPAGSWEVQVVRRTPESTSDRIQDELTWTSIRSVADRPPVALNSEHTLIELKIRASEQLSGVLQDVNCIATSILPVFDPPNEHYLSLPGLAGSCASTPDAPANSLTGDIDIRVRVALNDWTPATFQSLCSKSGASAGDYSFFFGIAPDAQLQFYLSTTGSDIPLAMSNATTGFADGTAHWLRVTRVRASGIVKFLKSEDGVTWSQIGPDATLMPGAAMFDSTSPVWIGAQQTGGVNISAGRFYRVELRGSIDGPVVAAFDAADAKTGTSSFVAPTGETWTLHGTAAIVGVGWVEQATRNPAWAFADVLRGSGAIRPLADARIDFDALKHWAGYCDAKVPNGVGAEPEPRVRFDHVVDYGTTTYQLLQSIAAAGRATPALRDGRHGVIVDEEQTLPVQLFTPRNSWGLQARRNYLNEPDGLRVKFIDPDNSWQEGHVLLYAAGKNELNSTTFEDLKLFGVTRYTQATRDARYLKAQALLRREEFTINCDLENLIAQRGDLVLVQHDVLKVGGESSRIIAVTGNRIQLADAFGLLPEGRYGVRVRLADGTITAPIESVPIAPDVFELSALPTPAPAAGDLVAWGLLEVETGEYLVKQIAPGDELTAQLTLAEVARAVYDADTGEIPTYSPPASGRPTAGPGPAVVNLAVEQIDATIAREPVCDLVLTWAAPQLGAYPKYRVYQINDLGLTTQIADTHLTRIEVARSLRLLDPDIASTPRTFGVIGIDAIGRQSIPAYITFTPVDPALVPGDCQYLSSNAHDKTTTLTWFAPTDPAVPGNAQVMFFEVRWQPAGAVPLWGTAGRVTELIPWNVTTVTVPSRNGAYLVKAITGSEMESPNAAITVIAVEDLVIQDFWALHRFAPAWSGVHDRTVIDSTGRLTLATEPDGTFPPVGVFYSNARVTFNDILQCRISAMLQASGLNNTFFMKHWIPLSLAAPLAIVRHGEWAASVWILGSDLPPYVMENWVPLESADPLDPVPSVDAGDFRPLLHGEYIARDLRFAVVLESFKPNVSPRIEQAGADIDFPERSEEYADIVVPDTGLNFSFARPFVFTPNVAVDLQDAAPGDFVDRGAADQAGFPLFIRNAAGAPIAGVVDISAFGVGRTL